jgi:lipopolysaccharide transport system permease protein
MALLFGRVLNAPSEGLPYLVFVLFGVHAWMAFERPAFWAVRSFDVYRRLARNLYMPLILIPISALVPALIEMCVIGGFAAGVLAYFSITDGTSYLQIGPATLLAPVGYALGLLLAQSVGMWLAVLNAYARDVRIIFIYVLRVWMFITPVVYPITQLTGVLRTLAEYNPVTPPVTIVKWALLGIGEFPWDMLWVTLVWLVVVGMSGLWFFARQAPTLLSRQPAGTFDDDEEV